MAKGQPGVPGGGGNGSGHGGGKPPSAGNKKGDLYGDQYVTLRDFDASTSNDIVSDKENGDGDGEPLYDANGNPILLGSDGKPIYYVLDSAGDWVIDPLRIDLVQSIDLGRANVARAPDSVMAKSLTEALAKLESAVDVDPAGRIIYSTGAVGEDGTSVLATIDSPLENLALYQHLMTAGTNSSWPAVQTGWPDQLKILIADNPNFQNWDPSSLLAAAFDKSAPISVDAVLTENTILGINTVLTAKDNLGNPIVDYFEFNNGTIETYTHSRDVKYGDTLITWLADPEGDGTFEYVAPITVFNAVFGGKEWIDPSISSGADDFAQAVEDSRAVISFMHDQLGAMEIVTPMIVLSQSHDVLIG